MLNTVKYLIHDPIWHPALIHIWNVQDLRMHLAQKLTVAHSEILVNAATYTLDVGSCDQGSKSAKFFSERSGAVERFSQKSVERFPRKNLERSTGFEPCI